MFQTGLDKIAEGILWYVVFIFSTTCHEAAHALTALKLGDRTAYEGGQVTFDPVPHIRREPVGTVLVPIISFLMSGWMIGWASAPYDPYWAMRYPKRSSLMALAGPLSNFLLVLVSFLLIRLGLAFGVFYAPDSIVFSHVTAAANSGIFSSIAKFLSILFSLNLILFTFNLLPLPPLDGSGLAPLFLEKRSAQNYLEFIRHNAALGFIGLYLAWKFFDVVFDPVHLFAINLLYPGMGYH